MPQGTGTTQLAPIIRDSGSDVNQEIPYFSDMKPWFSSHGSPIFFGFEDSA
jgi:hypothetical protein